MHTENQAAEHEAAAQAYLDSLLQAGDAAPVCHLALLETLAGAGGDGGACAPPAVQVGAPQPRGGRLAACTNRPGPWSLIAPLPRPPLQAAALRALGGLALLSKPLSRRAVQLAEAGL